jgi:hypothetical protein
MALVSHEDIVINQGTDVAIEIHLVHDSGSVYNLTNKTVTSKMKRRYADSAGDPSTVSFTSVIATPPTDGIVTLSLTNAVTDALETRGRYVYDVELSFVDDNNNTIIERILQGEVEVSPSVTR